MYRPLQPKEHYSEVQEPRPSFHGQRQRTGTDLSSETDQARCWREVLEGPGERERVGEEGRQEGDGGRTDGDRPRG